MRPVFLENPVASLHVGLPDRHLGSSIGGRDPWHVGREMRLDLVEAYLLAGDLRPILLLGND